MWYFWGGSESLQVFYHLFISDSGWLRNPIIKMMRVEIQDTGLPRQNINVSVPTSRGLCYVQGAKVGGDGWFC